MKLLVLSHFGVCLVVTAYAVAGFGQLDLDTIAYGGKDTGHAPGLQWAVACLPHVPNSIPRACPN